MATRRRSKEPLSAKAREKLEAEKRASVAQLLFKCARLVNEAAIERMRAQPGLAGLRAAHTTLFPHIDLEGTRLTVLAQRVGISKQATAQLVNDLEAMGALVRVPDPEDGRAKRIRFALVDGRPIIMRGLGVLRELEEELSEALGEGTLTALHFALVALETHLEH